jgi:hypothetical protein
VVIGVLAVVALGSGSLAASAAVADQPDGEPPATLTIWVSPQGSNDADGLSEDTPFATLQKANDYLCGSTTTCTGRDRPVEIRLAQKTFPVTKTTYWRYFDANYPTTFEPWSYRPGDGWPQVSKGGGHPTFDGAFGLNHAFYFTPAHAGSGTTGLRFVYLRWQRFNISAFEIHGGVDQELNSAGVAVSTRSADAANGLAFYGDYFYRIGNYWNPKKPMGWGAIDAYNSSGMSVVNSHFVQLMNTTADRGHMHGVYLSHGSRNADIDANQFSYITGDPVRQRDLSSNMSVTNNTFVRAGYTSYADDWYCRPNLPDSVCSPKEYRSFGGRFHDNVLKGLYASVPKPQHTVFCYDLPGGLCPPSRLALN